MDESTRNRFLGLAALLSATFHYEFHGKMEQLKNSYALLDPDRETVLVDNGRSSTPASLESASDDFFTETLHVLEQANFTRLDRQHIETAIGAASDWGVHLHVDFELFERLEVYSRGDVVGTRIRKRWRNAYRPEQVQVPMYQRLVVVFQLRACDRLPASANAQRVYLKLFKNIPKMDLDMLLPGTKVKMSRFDQGKILLPTLSGITLALIKIVKGVALLATATAAGMLSFLGILGGTVGYGVKSFLGYIRTKDKYQLSLTRSLYFQNLDNNAGVLFRILDEAEEQELREAILAWFLLWQHAPQQGWTEDELDQAAESFLAQEFSIDVDFEVDDAMQKLDRLGLSQRCSGDRWKAVSLDCALECLDRAWDNLFPYHNDDSNRHVA